MNGPRKRCCWNASRRRHRGRRRRRRRRLGLVVLGLGQGAAVGLGNGEDGLTYGWTERRRLLVLLLLMFLLLLLPQLLLLPLQLLLHLLLQPWRQAGSARTCRFTRAYWASPRSSRPFAHPTSRAFALPPLLLLHSSNHYGNNNHTHTHTANNTIPGRPYPQRRRPPPHTGRSRRNTFTIRAPTLCARSSRSSRRAGSPWWTGGWEGSTRPGPWRRPPLWSRWDD